MTPVRILAQREIVFLLSIKKCIDELREALKARLSVDRSESALYKAGELFIPKSEGRIGDEHIFGSV